MDFNILGTWNFENILISCWTSTTNLLATFWIVLMNCTVFIKVRIYGETFQRKLLSEFISTVKVN